MSFVRPVWTPRLRLARLLPAAATLGAAALLTACSSGGSTGSSSSGSISPPNITGNTSAVPGEIAERLGCTGLAADDQLDRYTAAEATCLYKGDNSVTIYAFDSAADEQDWFNVGPESADETGTVVLGSDWAVAPYNTSQAEEIAQVLSGQVRQEP